MSSARFDPATPAIEPASDLLSSPRYGDWLNMFYTEQKNQAVVTDVNREQQKYNVVINLAVKKETIYIYNKNISYSSHEWSG